MGKRGYEDYEGHEPPEEREDMKGWINFKRPIDLNTIVVMATFLIGGLSFRADTIAGQNALNEQVHEMKAQIFDLKSTTAQQVNALSATTLQQINALSARVDTAIDGGRRK